MIGDLISGAARLIGGVIGQDDAEDAAAQNIYQQRQFAKHGIKWRVKDALSAGIHPLYALGAQTASFSPVSVGSPMGEAVASMGQDVGRALAATMTGPEKAVAAQFTALALQKAGLENELLSTQISKLRALGSQPNFPSGNNVSGDVTPGTFPGEFMPGTSGIAKAQYWQDEYGDIAENIMGSYRFLADTITQPEVRSELRDMYNHFQREIVPALVAPFR